MCFRALCGPMPVLLCPETKGSTSKGKPHKDKQQLHQLPVCVQSHEWHRGGADCACAGAAEAAGAATAQRVEARTFHRRLGSQLGGDTRESIQNKDDDNDSDVEWWARRTVQQGNGGRVSVLRPHCRDDDGGQDEPSLAEVYCESKARRSRRQPQQARQVRTHHRIAAESDDDG